MIASVVKSVLAFAAFAAVTAALWRALERRGQPGWAILVPVYGFYALVRAAGRPAWWFVLTLVPLLNAGILAWLLVDLARGRGLCPQPGRRGA